jgi:copper chaperone CopZ
MSNTTSNTRHLQIDGMTGDACVQKVTTALNSVKGVTTKSVQVGSATITCDDLSKCAGAIGALGAAGFKSRESLAPPAATAANGTPATAAKANALPETAAAKAGQEMASEGAGGAIGGKTTGTNIGAPPHVVTPGKSLDEARAAAV